MNLFGYMYYCCYKPNRFLQKSKNKTIDNFVTQSYTEKSLSYTEKKLCVALCYLF